MTTKPRGGGWVKALMAGPLKNNFFCGFPYNTGIFCDTRRKGKLSNSPWTYLHIAQCTLFGNPSGIRYIKDCRTYGGGSGCGLSIISYNNDMDNLLGVLKKESFYFFCKKTSIHWKKRFKKFQIYRRERILQNIFIFVLCMFFLDA